MQVVNSDGNSYGIEGNDGNLEIWESDISAIATQYGYGIYIGDGDALDNDGQLVGSTAPIGRQSTSGYTLGAEKSTGAITVNSSNGNQITGLTIGNYYAVEAFNGPFYFYINPAQAAGYLFNLSKDRLSWEGELGTTEVPTGSGNWGYHLDLPTWAAYAEYTASPAVYGRCYFQATTTSIFIRVSDSKHSDNSGTLSWRLSDATGSTIKDGIVTIHSVRTDTGALLDAIYAYGDRSAYDLTNYSTRHASLS